MQKYTAIEITAPVVFDLVKIIEPLYEGLTYDEVHLKFAVFEFPSPGDLTIMSPSNLLDICDHLEPGIKIRLTQLHVD